MLNRIVIMGRLTALPELRYTTAQKAVVNFTLANERDRSDDVDFLDCVAWDKTAEFISKYFDKGSMAIVAGRLQSRSWEDKNGNKRKSYEINVENVYFGEPKNARG